MPVSTVASGCRLLELFKCAQQCPLRGNWVSRRYVRTAIFRRDRIFLSPFEPLIAQSAEPFEHSNDGYFSDPIVGRSNPGIGLIFLNLDRKPGDRGRGASQADEYAVRERNKALFKRLRRLSGLRSHNDSNPPTYADLGVHIPEKETAFNVLSLEMEGPLSGCQLKNKQKNQKKSTGRQCPLNKSSESPVSSLISEYYTSSFLSVKAVNMLYTQLRNHEVNPFRRVIALTSLRSGAFADGLDPGERLLMAEASQHVQEIQPYALHVLANLAELMWLIYTYKKPLISFSNGRMGNEGAALCCLANHSAVYENASLQFDLSEMGMTPVGGTSFLLERLPSHIGFYLALTGHALRGKDLLHTGLVNYWMAPDAIQALELTSGSQLDVSETDAKSLLEDYFFAPPARMSTYWEAFESVISWTFDAPTLEDALARLQDLEKNRAPAKVFVGSNASRESIQRWASSCRQTILHNSVLVQWATFTLMHQIREKRNALLSQAGITRPEWDQQLRNLPRSDTTLGVVSQQRFMKDVDDQVLEHALRLEIRCAARLLLDPEVLEYLSHAEGKRWNVTPAQSCQWQQPQRTYTSLDALFASGVTGTLWDPLPDKQAYAEFYPLGRSEISLSQHPWLRRMHPDYCRRSQLDYDPLSLQTDRWNPNFLATARSQLESLLSRRGRGGYPLDSFH